MQLKHISYKMKTLVPLMVFSIVILETSSSSGNFSRENLYRKRNARFTKETVELGYNVTKSLVHSRLVREVVPWLEPAPCIPELHTVRLDSVTNKADHYYIPSCTRIKRCGGCCNYDLRSCQPVEKVTKRVRVKVLRGLETRFGMEILTLEEHTSCACLCTIKPEHCTDKQIYAPHRCLCICPNINDKIACKENNDFKSWDPTSCTCKCRDVGSCTTGTYFDEKTCSCRI